MLNVLNCLVQKYLLYCTKVPEVGVLNVLNCLVQKYLLYCTKVPEVGVLNVLNCDVELSIEHTYLRYLCAVKQILLY